MHIGIDIGGVILGGSENSLRVPIFEDTYLSTKSVPGAFMAVYELLETSFEVSLISKCSPFIAGRTMEILDHLDFFNLTGFDEKDIYFVRKYTDKVIIAKALGIDIFIDDNPKNLIPMQDSIETILFTEYDNWEAVIQYIEYFKISKWPLRVK